MDDYRTLSQSVWECNFHVGLIPKYRRKVLFGRFRQELGDVFRVLARAKECEVEEGHLLPDHVHMLISIPPEHSVAQIVRYIKGKRSIHIVRVHFQQAPTRPYDSRRLRK